MILYDSSKGNFIVGTKLMLSNSVGKHVIEYRIYDKAGNEAIIPTFIILDMQAPEFLLEGVENGGITDTDVSIESLDHSATMSANGTKIGNPHTFTDNGYYQIEIKDRAGNSIKLEFVINKAAFVKIDNEDVNFISQNNAIGGKLIVEADATYPLNSGYIVAKVSSLGELEYLKGVAFTDDEYHKLISGEDVEFSIIQGQTSILVAFVVSENDLNKFIIDDSQEEIDTDIAMELDYKFIAVIAAVFISFVFFVAVISKSRKQAKEREYARSRNNSLF